MAIATEFTIPDDAIGQTLRSVSALIFHVPNEASPPEREAISLRFDSRDITIRSRSDTSELSIDPNELSIPDDPEFHGYHAIADVSVQEAFRPLIGKPLRNWWLLTNDGGYLLSGRRQRCALSP